MAINLKDRDHRARLARAIRRSFDLGASDRSRRADLISIFKDRSKLADLYLNDNERTAYLNLFALFVRGHEISLAYSLPKYAINARTMQGMGFDKRIQSFLEQYTCILNLTHLAQQWAMDSAFGRACAKVVTSIAPKGISSPVAPRTFRLNPDHVILDRSAASAEEVTYSCDIYFTDLDEAKRHPGFNKERRERLTEWSAGSGNGSDAFMGDAGDHELFATAQTRLIDVYIPTLGKLCTWPCPNDDFGAITNEEPLQELQTYTSPHKILDLLTAPDSLDIISRLGQLRPLNMLANDMFSKAATQARDSQRNPIAQLGDEQELHSVLKQPDGEAVFLSNPKALDIFTIPGPDQSIMAMANVAMGTFSSHAGNLNTQLGISPGAGTARQTQALIGQITQAQALDRNKFETFLCEVGKGLASIAFHDEALQLDYAQQVPGMNYYVNAGWGPPQTLPRIGTIDDYKFGVVPFSTAFRGPQERLGQLDAASQLVFRAMQMAATGAPLDIEKVLDDAAEAFDLVPNLKQWWNGQQPSPTEKTSQMYQSMAGPAQGSNVNYQGAGDDGGGNSLMDFSAPTGGLASGGV